MYLLGLHLRHIMEYQNSKALKTDFDSKMFIELQSA